MAKLRSWFLGAFFGFAALLLLAGAGVAWTVYTTLLQDLPDLHRLEDYRPFLASHVVDRSGRPIGEFFEERRLLVPVGAMPRHVVLAFVAGEDDTFFHHQGLDYWSILRAAWVNLRAGGRVKQGGSTITQQVAKSLLLTSERSYVRKLKDMLLAKRIEERFTKDEILYLYLNQIYLGHGAYGVGQAARSYFGKDIGEISVSEAALLAGLPKAPSDYSPVTNPAAAEERRLYVLRRMYDEGYIDEPTWRAAVAEKPRIAQDPHRDDFATAAYFTEEVRRALFAKLGGETVLRGGLTIETTLDLDAQRTALVSLRHGLEALDRRQLGWRGVQRHVSASEIDTTLHELAASNDLHPGPDGAKAALGSPRPLLGVVKSVDAAKGVATVGFAPGIDGQVAFADVAWALPKRLPADARKLSALLKVGDVAQFEPRSAAKAKPAKAEPPTEDGEAPPGAAPEEPAAETADAAAPPATAAGFVLAQAPKVEGALVSLDTTNGDVVALVGGYDFARSEFNRATQARRQPGSAFKAFVYGAALADGFSLSSTVLDEPVEIVDPGTGELWAPKNYTDRFLGAVPLTEAFARSLNNATIRLAMEIGIDDVIAFARKAGIHSPLGRNLSLALGSTEVTPLEITRAYATFAAGGRVLPPRFVTRVLDRDGKVIAEDLVLSDLGEGTDETPTAAAAAVAKAAAAPAADGEDTPAGETAEDAAAANDAHAARKETSISPAEAFLVTTLMRAPIERPYGTAHKAVSLERPLAGKTGTTNEQKDAWFIGYSPELVTGVWVGYDERQVLGDKETGGRAALPVWMEYMGAMLGPKPVVDFAVPDGVLFARVGEEDAAFEPMIAGRRAHRSASTGHSSIEDAEDGADLLRLDAF